jgi:pyruvate formate-lyase activating enzyme-like uncharacterized protein
MILVRKIRKLEGDSLIVGTLPQGCLLCARGSKMVLFVTGLCESSCYYCPLSPEKAGKDIVFADELPVSSDDDVLFEVDAIRGEGVGISGGDPLCTLDRTLQYIHLLKSKYGTDFHIHLYTSKSGISQEDITKLKEAGLDEIRFHPQSTDWSGIERAIKAGLVVGIEMPAIPGKTDYLKKTAIRAQKIGVSFLNINELEASESNFESLRAHGMRLTDMASASIEGSAATAKKVLEWSAKNLECLSVHFCSARYKDAIQMRNRLERRLEETIRDFEERDDADPLLVLGIIRAPHESSLSARQLQDIYSRLIDQFELPETLLNLDTTRMRIEIAPGFLQEYVEEIKECLHDIENLEVGISYEYPSWDRLQVIFEPL